MHLINDPFLNMARALKQAKDAGVLTNDDYQTMFNTIAVTAERDAQTCQAPVCGRTAHIIIDGVALCAVCALKQRGRC